MADEVWMPIKGFERCDDPQCPAARIPNHAHMTQAEQDELANLVVKAMAEDLLPTPLKHEPVEGYDFMPSGWCGGCEHCISYPAPTVCLACSYSPEGGPMEPVTWPCEHAPAATTPHVPYQKENRASEDR